jgi:hypothetical protein
MKKTNEEYLKAFRNIEAFSNLQNAFKINISEEEWKQFREGQELENKALIKLSEYGWYVSMQMSISFVDDILGYTSLEEIDTLDLKLSKYFTESLHHIQDAITLRLPKAKYAIQEAFTAHKNKMYYASTILFLSLADGYLNGNTFRTKHNKAKVKEILSEPHGLSEHLKLVLGQVSAIDADKGEYPSKLNRHAVIHGLDFTYGTEINSLKSLSILNLLAECYTPSIMKDESI